MKMKQLFMGLGLVAAATMAACSSDEPMSTPPVENQGESFYATITLSLPKSGSRTATGSTTEEAGKDYENNIQTISVLLAEKDATGKYKVVALNQGDAVGAGPMANPTYTLRFQQEDITAIAGKTIYTFVVCNPTTQLLSNLSGDANFVEGGIESILDESTFSGWTNNNFMMTNASEAAAREVPTDLKRYNTPETAFQLSTKSSPIKVERSVARFDYTQRKDGNKYEVKDEVLDEVLGYVTLTDVSMVNTGRDFYAFRRVSADGQGNWTLGGIETVDNYVVSPLFSSLGRRNYNNYVFASDNNSPANLGAISNWTSLDDISGSTSKIWRYAGENAVPAGVGNQIKRYATGVVFKGKISFEEGSALATSASNGEVLYMYGQKIYGNYAALQEEIQRAPNTSLAKNALDAGLYTTDGTDFDFVPEAMVNNGVNLSSKGFTVYRPNATGDYEVYYTYWNRHNDNSDPSVTGPMEFSVVRNNVYKLSVSNINTFGHPSSPDDDPDPETPDTPTEEIETYFSLFVEVLPWTVRVNDIEF